MLQSHRETTRGAHAIEARRFYAATRLDAAKAIAREGALNDLLPPDPRPAAFIWNGDWFVCTCCDRSVLYPPSYWRELPAAPTEVIKRRVSEKAN